MKLEDYPADHEGNRVCGHIEGRENVEDFGMSSVISFRRMAKQLMWRYPIGDYSVKQPINDCMWILAVDLILHV
ncbi:hypothetical protein ACT7DB_01080 [Bacillus cereus]